MPRNSSTKSRIGVAGTINRDTIYLQNGRTVESWGGLLYSIKYLCDQADSAADKIVPVVNLGADACKPVLNILGNFAPVDLSHIKRTEERNNHHLRWQKHRS